MEEKNKISKGMEDDVLAFMRAKHKSAQEKAKALTELAKKYNMTPDKLLKNIIMGWMNEDKEKKFGGK